MHRIRDWLYIANYTYTSNDYALEKHRIGAMLQLAISKPSERVETLYHPVEDGVALSDAEVRIGLDFIETHYKADQRILIACRAGVCRSAVFGIGALMQIENLSLREAYRVVKTHHPDSRPFYLPLQSLAEYFDEIFTEIMYNDLKAEFERRP